MKAIRFHQHGGPEVLQLDEVDEPTPGSGQVLVRVYAAGVNPTDVTGRRGGGAQAATFPATLGRDAAGVVEGIGSGVKNVKSGDKVIVRTSTTGYSEILVAKEEDIYPVPGGVGPIDAASIGVTYSTAWDAVVNRANVQAGQTVLVQGASGGVGIAAVQIGKAMGAKVIGNASTEGKRAWVLAQGADFAVDYTQPDWPAKVKELNGGNGVNAIIDGVGGDAFVRSFECLAQGGFIVIFGASGGREVTLNLTALFRSRGGVLSAAGAGSSREDFEKMLTYFTMGKLKTTVEKIIPLAEAAEAHRLIEERKVIGKIVLKVG